MLREINKTGVLVVLSRYGTFISPKTNQVSSLCTFLIARWCCEKENNKSSIGQKKWLQQRDHFLTLFFLHDATTSLQNYLAYIMIYLNSIEYCGVMLFQIARNCALRMNNSSWFTQAHKDWVTRDADNYGFNSKWAKSLKFFKYSNTRKLH